MVDAATESYRVALCSLGIHGEAVDDWRIRDAETELRVLLPEAYKAFLLIAGSAFTPFQGSQYTMDDGLAELQRQGSSVAQKDGNILPSDSFVFFVHQGFVARFFLLDDGENPAVYEYVEKSPPAKCLARTFTQFVADEQTRFEALSVERFPLSG